MSCSLTLASLPCAATAQSKATLDVSETLFSVVAAMNVCGYDAELQSSSPIRMEVRADLVEASKSPDAAAAAKEMCRFYHDHQQGDSAHDLAQYVSLALNLGGPPDFAPKMKESDMPPDSTYVLGFVPLLKQYYAAAKLHSIWLKHQPQYLALIDEYHDPVARMITSTDNYLRMPLSGYLGRSFTVYLEPMSAPGQVNSRNYLQDYYYLVVSPAAANLHMDAMRHTYLHFVLDPLIAKRATALQRLKPVLMPLQKAPMAEDYKLDTGLAGGRVPDSGDRSAHAGRSQIAGQGPPGHGAAGRGRRIHPYRLLLRAAAGLRKGEHRPAGRLPGLAAQY